MDALRVSRSQAVPSGYEVVVKGGRERTGIDAVAWARRAEELGAGEICLNSIDADGTKTGYELEITRQVCRAVGIPVIASGGAGAPDHLATVLAADVGADAALVASLVHIDGWTVGSLKAKMAEAGVPVRI
jgi:cyclase